MTRRPTITDDAIAAMLRARADAPVPVGLARTIADAVATDAPGSTGAGRRGSRAGRRTWPFLLVAAALLLAMAGGALVLSRPTTELPAPTPGPSAVAVVPSPSTAPGDGRCADMDGIAEGLGIPYADSIDPSSIIRTNGGPPANGPVLAALTDSADDAANLRFMRIEPDGASEPRRLGRGSSIEAGALTAMVPAPSGRAVALAFDRYDGPVLTSPDCADVFVVTDDFVRYRRVFRARLGERYTDPVWSADGSRLYAIKSNSRPCKEVAVSTTRTSYDCDVPLESSVVAWNVATDEDIDLGRPCEGCQPEGQPLLSPDGRRLAVPYLDPSDGYRVAILDQAGAWSRIPLPPDWVWSELAGWLDDSRLLMADSQGNVQYVQADTGAVKPSSCGVGPGSTSWCDVVSPDRSRSAFIGRMGGWHGAIVTDIETGEQTRIPTPDPSALLRTYMSGLIWSPDSGWLALEVTDSETGTNGLYVVPADRSAEPRPVEGGTDGSIVAWAWLPAAP